MEEKQYEENEINVIDVQEIIPEEKEGFLKRILNKTKSVAKTTTGKLVIVGAIAGAGICKFISNKENYQNPSDYDEVEAEQVEENL